MVLLVKAVPQTSLCQQSCVAAEQKEEDLNCLQDMIVFLLRL